MTDPANAERNVKADFNHDAFFSVDDRLAVRFDCLEIALEEDDTVSIGFVYKGEKIIIGETNRKLTSQKAISITKIYGSKIFPKETQ